LVFLPSFTKICCFREEMMKWIDRIYEVIVFGITQQALGYKTSS
jgi:hypothetical protein